MNKQGFTLIEILVTVLIVGIMAAFAMPSYYRFLERSRTADAVNTMGTALNAQNRYYVKSDRYTPHWPALDAVPDVLRHNGTANGYCNANCSVYYTKGGGEANPKNGFAIEFELGKNEKFLVSRRIGSDRYQYQIVRPFDEPMFYCIPSEDNEEDLRLCLDFMGVDTQEQLPKDPRLSAT